MNLTIFRISLISFALTFFVTEWSEARSKLPEKDLIKKGAQVFKQNCVACHGVKGDGRGPAAAAITNGAKPRDFTTGIFAYGDTPDQIFATITKGAPGTAMPSWDSLSEDDRWSLVYYVKSLKKR